MCCGCSGCATRVSFACLFFFFKQKTAYEMRISDWSSDVCSSDLPILVVLLGANELPRIVITFLIAFFPLVLSCAAGLLAVPPELMELGRACKARSEEHTSELQSLMRSSYAVFCLKKKNKRTHMRQNTCNKHKSTDERE